MECEPVDALAYDVPVAGRMIGVGTTKVWELVRSGACQLFASAGGDWSRRKRYWPFWTV
jgi:hypothetical protein